MATASRSPAARRSSSLCNQNRRLPPTTRLKSRRIALARRLPQANDSRPASRKATGTYPPHTFDGNSMGTFITSLAIGLFAAAAAGEQPTLAWPQFRGPGGSGIADGQKPPVELGPDKNVKWKSPVPRGSSSPIVVGNLLVLTALDDGKLYTIAYTRADGKEAWRAHAPAASIEPYHITEGSPAASTPVTDGKRIISYFGSCGLFCYDLAGKQLWKYELPTAATPFDFGSGVSPVLADGLVILVRDENKNSKILAVDATTGGLKWEQQRESRSSFCTPVVCDTPHGKEVVAAGHGKMIGYDLKTGAENWSVVGMPSCAVRYPGHRRRHALLRRLVTRR